MTTTDTTKTAWHTLTLAHPGERRELAATSAEGRALLARYRDDGSIPEWYLASLDELDALDDFDADAPDLGPAPERIDWSDFDA
jgi:hypothetical protein